MCALVILSAVQGSTKNCLSFVCIFVQLAMLTEAHTAEVCTLALTPTGLLVRSCAARSRTALDFAGCCHAHSNCSACRCVGKPYTTKTISQGRHLPGTYADTSSNTCVCGRKVLAFILTGLLETPALGLLRAPLRLLPHVRAWLEGWAYAGAKGQGMCASNHALGCLPRALSNETIVLADAAPWVHCEPAKECSTPQVAGQDALRAARGCAIRVAAWSAPYVGPVLGAWVLRLQQIAPIEVPHQPRCTRVCLLRAAIAAAQLRGQWSAQHAHHAWCAPVCTTQPSWHTSVHARGECRSYSAQQAARCRVWPQ